MSKKLIAQAGAATPAHSEARGVVHPQGVADPVRIRIPLSAPAPGRDVDFGLAAEFDKGVRTSVAINFQGMALEMHEEGGSIFSRFGEINGATVSWGAPVRIDSGTDPSCALDDDLRAVVTYWSKEKKKLCYRRGSVTSGSMAWKDRNSYDDGSTPSVALSNGVLVEVHQGSNQDTWYRVGDVTKGPDRITWRQDGAQKYGKGGKAPHVALRRQTVVEVHERNGELLYIVGRLDGRRIDWGSDQRYATGSQPAVALAEDGSVIEVHREPGSSRLVSRVGKILGSSIEWGESLSPSFDTGAFPAVACNGTLNQAIRTHKSENFDTLWFSTSLLTDRSRWMEDRLPRLKDKTLAQLAIPGSHDSGMYRGGVIETLGRTQDLSIYGQLANGIRYFDLRPKWKDGKFYMHHGPIQGPSLQEILDDVKRFFSEGRRELAILKLSHYEDFDNDRYRKMVEQIRNTIGAWLYQLPAGRRLSGIPLGEYLASRGAVLVVCDGSYPLDNKSPGIHTYRNSDSCTPEKGDLRVFDQYADTVSYGKMKDDQLRKLGEYDGVCKRQPGDGPCDHYQPGVPCDLFLLSWTLTPVTDVKDFSKEANRNLGGAMAELKIPNRYGKIPNIVYVDYVEDARVTDVCLYLNGE